jgi:hypothetical protein
VFEQVPLCGKTILAAPMPRSGAAVAFFSPELSGSDGRERVHNLISNILSDFFLV